MHSDTTDDSTGAVSVPNKTAGLEEDHFTVILMAQADAVKLKPYACLQWQRYTHLIKDLQKLVTTDG